MEEKVLAKKRTMPVIDPSSLEWIGLKLITVGNRYVNAFYAEIEAELSLQRDDIAVIVCLCITNATTAQEIVSFTARPKNSISRAIIGLTTAGILNRSSHPNDGRAACLSLTKKGHRTYQIIRANATEHDAKLIGDLTDAEKREFNRLLNIVSNSSIRRT
jgi:DNA-binding MarR family transcriptional regulator